MSIEAMKQALQALEFAGDLIAPITENCQCKICLAHTALRQAIAEAEKQEPVAFVSKCNDGECLISLINPAAVFYTAPVHASDISQERVDETAKDRHEHEDDLYDVWVEQGTCQENRQVAMRRTTRDEKIVNPGVYEVPEFECPRCGHCCLEREWVGLTKDEVDSWQLPVVPTVFQFAQFVEAKLKEKNCD